MCVMYIETCSRTHTQSHYTCILLLLLYLIDCIWRARHPSRTIAGPFHQRSIEIETYVLYNNIILESPLPRETSFRILFFFFYITRGLTYTMIQYCYHRRVCYRQQWQVLWLYRRREQLPVIIINTIPPIDPYLNQLRGVLLFVVQSYRFIFYTHIIIYLLQQTTVF